MRGDDDAEHGFAALPAIASTGDATPQIGQWVNCARQISMLWYRGSIFDVLVLFALPLYSSAWLRQLYDARRSLALQRAGGRIPRHRRRSRAAARPGNAVERLRPLRADARIAFDDGWRSIEELPAFETTVTEEKARKIITRNDSPDIGFDRSINPYRGCEHGCVYCFARPTHANMGLSAGLDFESKLFVKPDAPELLEREISAPNYSPRVIAIGTNTDPYQPIERKYEVMRGILEVLDRANHPVGIVTKSALVTRDIDILARMARRNLAKVALSVTSLDPKLARTMEPRAATPSKRLEAVRLLAEAGIPTSVMVAPIIPAINDAEIERILDAAVAAGAREAGYVLLRLPLEVRDLFREWLMANFPDRARHVFKLIRDTRGGKDYDSKWGERMTGTGPIAWMIGRRFEAACERLGLNRRKLKLSTEHFTPTRKRPQQLALF
jgi:DNA repair photolyase